MLTMLAQNWWAFALRGLAAVLFGVLAFIWPGVTLTVLVLLFGTYALTDGLFAVATGIQAYGENERWWVVLLEGLVGIAIGVLTFISPGSTGLALLTLIAAWALITGVLEIVAAIRLRKAIEGEWLLVLSGAASILFGLLVLVQPGAGALALLWLIASYAILFGVLLIILAFRLRGLRPAAAATP